MSDRYIRITGDLRVPPSVDADAVADALVEMAESRGWGFNGAAHELTSEELAGSPPVDEKGGKRR
ncbi:hypothetical protein [Symbiobacterium thermophilum]|uniref:hypothetical protein n=1 Tax=Symbiobacterium thermophilum TaxID=2734 RepID=UPI0002E7B846|nr:hypothetical protein [Symbiobacterium thermophilum]